jgi:hypothetical protein
MNLLSEEEAVVPEPLAAASPSSSSPPPPSSSPSTGSAGGINMMGLLRCGVTAIFGQAISCQVCGHILWVIIAGIIAERRSGIPAFSRDLFSLVIVYRWCIRVLLNPANLVWVYAPLCFGALESNE